MLKERERVGYVARFSLSEIWAVSVGTGGEREGMMWKAIVGYGVGVSGGHFVAMPGMLGEEEGRKEWERGCLAVQY